MDTRNAASTLPYTLARMSGTNHIELIGAGGFGVVAKATHDGSADPIALKLVFCSTEESLTDASRERILESFEERHRGVVSLHGYHVLNGEDPLARTLDEEVRAALPAWIREDTGRPFPRFFQRRRTVRVAVCVVAYEFLSGGEMFDWFTSRVQRLPLTRPVRPHFQPAARLSEAVARAVFFELVQAVAHIHAQSVAHLDLKLENVIAVPEQGSTPRVVVVDFGLAERGDAGGGSPTRAAPFRRGSNTYMAPELRPSSERGRLPPVRGPVDLCLADIFSLGVLLFQLVTGVPPWRKTILPPAQEACPFFEHYALSSNGSLYRHLEGLGRLPPDELSHGCLDVLQHTLALDPANRLSAAQLLEHPWLAPAQAAAQAAAAQAAPPQAPPQAQPAPAQPAPWADSQPEEQQSPSHASASADTRTADTVDENERGLDDDDAPEYRGGDSAESFSNSYRDLGEDSGSFSEVEYCSTMGGAPLPLDELTVHRSAAIGADCWYED